MNKKQRSCDGREAAQRPVWPKKTGARSARADMRGQNPLVNIYYRIPNSVEAGQRGLNSKRPTLIFFLGPTKPLQSY